MHVTLVLCDSDCDLCAGATSTKCKLGTDCMDCGQRKEHDLGKFACSNTCSFKADGHCDDGGPGSHLHTDCPVGSDCDDCGPRLGGAMCIDGQHELCGRGCLFASDGHCDDGGHGSIYQSCTLGSDCDDCGTRMQPCRDEDAEHPSPPPPSPPAQCEGNGAPKCVFGRCDRRYRTQDCRRCDCAGCDFCTAPAPSPPAPPPPPLPQPPWSFSCQMLDRRTNLRLLSPPLWCYSVELTSCEQHYTYTDDEHGSERGLSMCRIVGGKCVGEHIPVAAFVTDEACMRTLRDHSVPAVATNSAKPKSLPPPSPQSPSPAPTPPSPPQHPPPPPCIPFAAKCGGHDWTGVTKCCDKADGSAPQCFKRNSYYSSCRLSCPSGWECAQASIPPTHNTEAAPSPSVVAPEPSPPSLLKSKPKITSPSAVPKKRASPPGASATRWSLHPPPHSDTSLSRAPSGTSNSEASPGGDTMVKESTGGATSGALQASSAAHEKQRHESASEHDVEEPSFLSKHKDYLVYIGILVALIGGLIGGLGIASLCWCYTRLRSGRTKGHEYMGDLATQDDWPTTQSQRAMSGESMPANGFVERAESMSF